jgi:5'-nucleotidase
MPLDLSDTLVIGVSSSALFDLTEAEEVFRVRGIKAYRRYMLDREHEPLSPGTGLPLVRALLGLNRFSAPGEPPLVEVVVMSQNSPETGLRVLQTIRTLGLPITRSAFTGGEPVSDYIEPFDVDLFLSRNPLDVQKVLARTPLAVPPALPRRPGAAPRLFDPPRKGDTVAPPDDQVRIAFDADAVVFSESAEVVYKRDGLQTYHSTEDREQDIPLAEGPYATFLKKLARLQERLPISVEYSPVRIAIVTARNAPAEMRVIKTLRAWDVYVDEAFFLGGVEKRAVLEAFRPHIFFDDQDVHLDRASQVVPSGKVPYPSNSPLSGDAGLGAEKSPAETAQQATLF